jgi:hypothetical protein
MTEDREIAALEKEGWNALATSTEAATAFYESVLAADARMLLPGGLQLDGKDAILEALAAQPWSSFELHDLHEIDLGSEARALTYRVTAQRGEQDYEALISSIYMQTEGHWRLALHQQTPV